MKPPSKALTAKRQRLVRSLDAHVRWLRVAETLAPWTPPVREPHAERPRLMARYRGLPAYVYPVERPALARPCPGPEAITDAQMKAYVAVHPFVRGGLQPATVRALCFLETFAPQHRFRHLFGSTLLDQTSNLRTVQEAMGHASIRSTQVYTRVRSSQVRDAIVKLPWGRPAGETT